MSTSGDYKFATEDEFWSRHNQYMNTCDALTDKLRGISQDMRTNCQALETAKEPFQKYVMELLSKPGLLLALESSGKGEGHGHETAGDDLSAAMAQLEEGMEQSAGSLGELQSSVGDLRRCVDALLAKDETWVPETTGDAGEAVPLLNEEERARKTSLRHLADRLLKRR